MLATYLEDITLEDERSMRRGLDDGEWPGPFASKLPMTEELGSLVVPFSWFFLCISWHRDKSCLSIPQVLIAAFFFL